VGVDDILPDTGFISGVDPQPISLDVDPSFMEPKFMPQYKVAFGMSARRTQSVIDQFLS
jgi:hypothetical protein